MAISDIKTEPESFSPRWGDDAPKGAKVVLGRIIKDGAKVPLFFGQTLAHSLRDMGYNSTTSALCEHADNAIQWGATEVRIYFNQTGKRGGYQIDVLVLDNGEGMAPHVLKVATSFGGSMVYENRDGIGRYGLGMKAAALSMGPVMDLYSWQEPGAIYNMTLDVDDIGNNRSNLIELPDPNLIDDLPSEVSRILYTPMVFPKNPTETQDLLAYDVKQLPERLGPSGTIVFMPGCDRLTSQTAQTLVEHATKEMARIYRRQLDKGLRLFVNNRRVEPFDPTYWLLSARHTRVEDIRETRSRLMNSWQIEMPVAEGNTTHYPVSVRLYALPIEDWGDLPRTVVRNSLRVYDDHTVSFMRNDREVHIGTIPELTGKKHHDNNWLRVQVDFPGQLDEAFGVAVNKQGVRPKKYVLKLIAEKTQADVTAVKEHIKKHRSEQAALQSGSKLSEAERRANDADRLQGKPMPQPASDTEEEKQALEGNLRALAIGLKRDGETDDEAFERIRHSKFVTVFKHDDYWPFYHIDFTYGKVVLTINTAHSFFAKLYEPLSKIAANTSVSIAGDEADESDVPPHLADDCAEVLIALQLLLLSLARTQSLMSTDDESEEHHKLFEKLRREWSANLETQLTTR
jgi:hypothetical protein